MTTRLEDTAFARLQAEGRLLNSVLKAATHKPGRFGFRGDIALKFPAKLADEARPPEISSDQVIATAMAGAPHLEFVAGFLLSFETLKLVAEVLGDLLSPQGRYFFFVDNVDISKKYQVDFGGATFHILPIDESTVYNELLALLYLDKGDLKKLDTAGKTDAVADKALGFSAAFEPISFEEGVQRMGPVRNLYENRPV
jgi:hypothetical protein